MNIKERLNKEILLFDGAMGTMLQERGLKSGELPEILNITHPDIIKEIHREYVLAGSDIITANTFGANGLKLKDSGFTAAQIITAAVENAKAAGAKYVALDIGPLGGLMEPMGTLKFQSAYELFSEQISAGKKAGADLIIIETMSDLYEAKAAILAAKENCGLPVFCSMTFAQNGRTFIGCDALTAVITLEGLGADAIGVNCSQDLESLIPVVDTFIKYSHKPVIVQPNAGLPQNNRGETFYDVTPEKFADAMLNFARKGVTVLGGCCGTTPEHISRLKKQLTKIQPPVREITEITAASSGTKTVILDGRFTVIGERINPTGKKRLKEALKANDFDYILGEAISQAEAGADILDVNCGLPDINEPDTLCAAVKEIQSVINLPLQVDSSDAGAIEKAVRIYNGKPVINSVNASLESMERIFPIAKKYGALIIGLTLDHQGIPETAEGRFELAERIVETAQKYGISKKDIIIDCLTLTASAQQALVAETLKAVSLIRRNLNVKTVLGVSNVSFGLPDRELLNSAFLAASLGSGLDSAIINPLSSVIMNTVRAFKVLNNQDKNAENYIKICGALDASVTEKAAPINKSAEGDLLSFILDGRKEKAAARASELLKSKNPLDIIDNYFIPALDKTGKEFESGRIFLPQLMQAAETVTACFEIIKNSLPAGDPASFKGKIIVATVKGDIHDIGKNIAKTLLQNYGYDVIDLGKDVDPDVIVQKAKEQNIKLVGLSALMTTTIQNMKDTVQKLRTAVPGCRIMAGGAVLNEEYIRFVGADYYAKDALEGVKIAAKVFNKNP